jgi:hypothetical protein
MHEVYPLAIEGYLNFLFSSQFPHYNHQICSLLHSQTLLSDTIMTEDNTSSTSTAPPPGAGYVTTDFPVAGLSRVVRHITGHDSEGRSVFLSTDCGDHHRVMGEQQAIANIIYSTNQTPIELNGDVDIKYAKENEVKIYI